MMSLKFLSVLPLLVTAVFCLFFSTMMAIMEMCISRIQDGPSETSGHAHLPYTVYAIEFLRFFLRILQYFLTCLLFSGLRLFVPILAGNTPCDPSLLVQ